MNASLIHYFYCLNISLLKTLERYQRYIYASADAAVPSSDEMQVRGVSILLLLQYFNICDTTFISFACLSHNNLLLLTLSKFWNYTYQVSFKHDQLLLTNNTLHIYNNKIIGLLLSILFINDFLWKHFIIKLCISISVFHFWSNDFHENRISIKLSTNEIPSSQLI